MMSCSKPRAARKKDTTPWPNYLICSKPSAQLEEEVNILGVPCGRASCLWTILTLLSQHLDSGEFGSW